MADNTNKVTIDADYFDRLYRLADMADNLFNDLDALEKKRDELVKKTNKYAKELLALSKEREELKAKFAAAERCIEDIEPLIGEYTVGDCYPHGPAGEKMLNIIRAYHAAKEAK